MINLLLSIIVLAIVFGLVWYVLTLLPLPHPFGQIVRVCVVLVFVLVLLGMAFGGLSFPAMHLR